MGRPRPVGPIPILTLLVSQVILGCSVLRPATEPTPAPSATAPPSGIQLRVYDEIVAAIRDEYFLADFGGVDWAAQSGSRRSQVANGLDSESFADLVRGLLDLLPVGAASYLTRDERIAAELAETSVYSGIGAFVGLRAEPEPRIILLSVIESSPADEAGLLAHDAIYAVEGQPVRAEEGDAAIERVRGPEGTQVRLLVGSPDGTRRTHTLTRRQVTASDPVRTGIYADRLIYILAPVTADATLAQAVRAAISREAGEVQGLILDLRVAHSSPAWPILELFTLLADGEMGTFYRRGERSVIEVEGEDVDGSQSIPLVLLVGPDTAGTPEIFAAALQAVDRADTVGLPSAGRVLGYARRVLSDGSLLNYASSSFETVDGTDLGRTGAPPDTLVQADWDQVSPTFDPVLQAAGEILFGPSSLPAP